MILTAIINDTYRPEAEVKDIRKRAESYLARAEEIKKRAKTEKGNLQCKGTIYIWDYSLLSTLAIIELYVSLDCMAILC